MFWWYRQHLWMVTLTWVWCYAHSLCYHRHNHPHAAPQVVLQQLPLAVQGNQGPVAFHQEIIGTLVFIINSIMSMTIMNITIIFPASPLCLVPIPLKLATLAPSLSCSMITRLRWFFILFHILVICCSYFHHILFILSWYFHHISVHILAHILHHSHHQHHQQCHHCRTVLRPLTTCQYVEESGSMLTWATRLWTGNDNYARMILDNHNDAWSNLINHNDAYDTCQ